MGIAEQIEAQLSVSLNEKDVENGYRHYLLLKIPDMIFTSPYKCDGFGQSKLTNIKVLTEFKDELELTNKINQVKVPTQTIFYLKKFEINGELLPTTILVGDKKNCFVIHTNDVFKYLSMDLDWNKAPSEAHKNIKLVNELLNDETITPHVFTINKIDECLEKLKNLTDGVTRLIPITPHNIVEVFNYFETNILGKHNLNTNQIANLFVQILINPDGNYLHPVKKRKTIVTKSFNEVPIKTRESYTSFFKHFQYDYSPRQKEELTAVVDRLILDVTRRKQGEFFTPTIWVNKAHEYITSVFGEDWKEKYVVWDPAWGTGNLTRDYKFKELYVSTLNYSDIQTAEQMGYNPEAIKFQFDFLNDDYDFLPQGLRDAIESGREIIVLMNPPYGRTTGLDGRFSNISVGATSTEISDLMKKMKISGSDNFFTQFLFKCVEMNLTNLCTFTPSNFQTGESFKTFRQYFYDKIELKNGFIFQASNFDDVADDWSIQFSVTQQGKYNVMKEIDILYKKNDLSIDKLGSKILISTDTKKSLKTWIKNENVKSIDFPKLSSPFSVKESKWGCGIQEKSLATLVCNSNSPSKNAQSVYIINGGITENVGKIFLMENNFLEGCSIFSSRRIIEGNWINWYDEYLVPNEDHENFKQFKYDSVIYSLFNTKSNQSSLRQVTYKDKLWDIKNEFFWVSKEEMMDSANNNNYNELYSDARTDTNRYVYKLLFEEQDIYNNLSPDAKLVLDKATELVRMSMSIRSHFADDNNHLNSWDAGYAQLKLIWKEYFPEEFKEFRQLYKNLEDRMRPLVYELGFLIK